MKKIPNWVKFVVVFGTGIVVQYLYPLGFWWGWAIGSLCATVYITWAAKWK